MIEPDPIKNLVERCRVGDSRAEEELFHRYSLQLVRLAEGHLSRKIAARVDGEDVVQSVFRTFFRRSALGEFQIDDSNQLWRLLVTLTLRKARGQARHHLAEQRAATCETPGDGNFDLAETMAQVPSSSQVAEFVDQVENLLRNLPELYCYVLQKRLEGYSVVQIAGQLSVSRQTVYRALDLLGQRLTRSISSE